MRPSGATASAAAPAPDSAAPVARPATRRAPREPAQAAQPSGASAESLASPALTLYEVGKRASVASILLLVGLLAAILLLGLATASPTRDRREGSVAATLVGLRLEIATGGGTLLLLSAIGFFLTA